MIGPRHILLIAFLVLGALCQQHSSKTYDEAHTVTYNNLAGQGGLIEPQSGSKKKKADNVLAFESVQKLTNGC